MSFLAPLFFSALAALGVPILIHMIHRQRTEVIEFPSLMFVRKIPFRSLRRQRIRHRFLLLLRCAALVLLVAAFSRPFFRSALLAAVAGGSREVVILVDRSYSMGYGSRWQRAQNAAVEVVRGLEQDDYATVIFFDSSAQAGLRSTRDQASLLSAINETEPGAGITRYGPALQLAQGIFEDSDQPRLEAFLVSDFQRIGVESAANTVLPPGTVLTPVLVTDEDEIANVGVAGVSVQRDFFSGRERAVVTTRLVNRSHEAISDLGVSLELSGRELESLSVAVDADSSSTLTFAPFTLEDTAMPIAVHIGADALPHDNAFYFTVAPGDVVPVLVVGSPGATDANLYLSRALAIGSSPLFNVTVRSVDQLTTEDVVEAEVVILNDVGLPNGEIGAAITQFVTTGGGLWVVLGERVQWSSSGNDLLPGTFGQPIDRDGRGGTLGFVDYSHEVFEVFSAPRSGDLTAPRFYRYRPLDGWPETGVLARFDNGASAMVEHAVGAGRVLVWTSTVDSFWNDFALKPIYLPFVHKVTEYLADYTPPTPYLTVGQVLDLEQYPSAADLDLIGGSLVVRDPSEGRVTIDNDRWAGFVELDQQGFYEIRDTNVSDSVPVTVAVNVDLAESNLERVDPQELVAIVTGRASADRSVSMNRRLEPEDLESRQTVWWYLLIGALGFLAGETVVSNRLSRTELDQDD